MRIHSIYVALCDCGHEIEAHERGPVKCSKCGAESVIDWQNAEPKEPKRAA
jgi:hypothetical protein